MKTIKISIEEWCEMAKEGKAPPVEITLAGTSMEPLIRRDRDLITIEAYRPEKDPELSVGEIVLFQRADGAFVVHRIFRIDGDMITTLGDNCEKADPPVHRTKILGRVVKIKRGERILSPGSKSQRRYAQVCMKLLPVRKRVLHYKLVAQKNLGKDKK